MLEVGVQMKRPETHSCRDSLYGHLFTMAFKERAVVSCIRVGKVTLRRRDPGFPSWHSTYRPRHHRMNVCQDGTI